jgi:uncharacterized membrane protein
VYHTLLFLHLLSAFIAFVTIAIFGAYTLGAPVGKANFRLADISWNVSGAGLLIFGVWLALYVDGYEIWDGWILGALVLFLVASAFGAWARKGVATAMDGGAEAEESMRRAATWHWLRTLAMVGILVLMIWKPGA